MVDAELKVKAQVHMTVWCPGCLESWTIDVEVATSEHASIIQQQVVFEHLRECGRGRWFATHGFPIGGYVDGMGKTMPFGHDSEEWERAELYVKEQPDLEQLHEPVTLKPQTTHARRNRWGEPSGPDIIERGDRVKVKVGTTSGVVIGVTLDVDGAQVRSVTIAMTAPDLFLDTFWARKLEIVKKGVR